MVQIALSYTAHIVNGFRTALAYGNRSTITAELQGLMDAASYKDVLPEYSLSRWAAAVIIIDELADHDYDSGRRRSHQERYELQHLGRLADAGLSKAMEGLTVDELNNGEYVPVEGGEWRSSVRQSLRIDEVTVRWEVVDSTPRYRFRRAIQDRLDEQAREILSRSYAN